MATPISSDPIPEYQLPPDLKAVDTRGSGLDGMEVDGLPLAPEETIGHTALGTASSPNTGRQNSNKRTKGLTEPDTSPTSPKERASIIQYQHYVKETMQTLQQPDHIHTQIVDSFGISIKGKDFATLLVKEMLSDGIVDWMCQWWTTQVGGGIGDKAGIGQPRITPHLSR